MSKFPAMPLFVDAYMGNTWHLTDADHGRYLLLLMLMWQQPHCRIPDDDEWISRRLRRPIEDIKNHFRPVINEFCFIEENFIKQKRLLKELFFVKKISAIRKKAAKARWEKKKTNDAFAMQKHRFCNAPTPTPTPTPNNNKKGQLVFVKKGTPAWDAHQSLRPHRPLPCKDYDIGGRYETGWFFPSEYPASWKENQH